MNINNQLRTMIVGILILIILFGCGSKDNGIDVQPPIIIDPTATYLPLSTETSTPFPTPTSIPPASTLGIGSTMVGKDGMILLYVPSGEFTMGSDNGESDEEPVHTVFLDTFWIDKTEVTVHMYYLCVQAGVCKEPTSKKSSTRSSYYGNVEFDNYPVIYVDWDMAKTYCEWVGRRLPTEAEWEKAARGENAFTYPWGDDPPNNNLLNYNNAVGDTSEVGKYPNGVSPYGALDMAGNVWEWVNDWYSDAYYSNSPPSNPLRPGPDSGQHRVFRGGSWNYDYYFVRSAVRGLSVPSVTFDDFGFRCSRSP